MARRRSSSKCSPKLTRAEKRVINRAKFRAQRKRRAAYKRTSSRRGKARKSSYRSTARRGKARKSSRRSHARRGAKRYSAKSYTRFGRRKSSRHYASSLKHRPSLADLMAMNHELGINPRGRKGKRKGTGKRRARPSKCWGMLRSTRRKLYSRR